MADAKTRQEILDWLHSQEGVMFALLEQLVNTESGSYNKAGVDRVGQILQERLQSAGIRTTIHPSDTHGNCLSAEVPGSDGPGAPHVLLMGHMDTVFPDGTVAERPYRAEGSIAYGPGVADMKAGLVMNTYVAMAFAKFGGNRLPIRVLFTADEEIASPSSRALILSMARGAATVPAEKTVQQAALKIRIGGQHVVGQPLQAIARADHREEERCHDLAVADHAHRLIRDTLMHSEIGCENALERRGKLLLVLKFMGADGEVDAVRRPLAVRP